MATGVRLDSDRLSHFPVQPVTHNEVIFLNVGALSISMSSSLNYRNQGDAAIKVRASIIR